VTSAGPFTGMSIADVAEQLRDGRTTARALAESALASADETALNCFVTVDHDGALRAAEQADRELAAGLDRGPLHGIPVGVKDLIDTAGLRTTRGSRHFDQHVPVRDAAVVIALRQAGAVIVGKTHTHQFAYGPTGDVAHTGAARNPHDPTRMTGGSSSGSGAAVAAGLVLAALGTDTGGSVRIPAALCGIVGMRPSQGAVSSAGVFPLSSTLDTVGPMAGSVVDMALLWSVLVGRPVIDVPVDGLRVGVVRSDVTDQIVPQQAEALDRAVAALKAGGFVVGETPMPEMAELGQIYLQIQRPEARAVHAERIERSPELFEPEVLHRLINPDTPGWEYVAAKQAQRDHQSRPLGADLLVLPTVPIEAPPIGARDTDLGAGWTNPMSALLAFNSPWSVLGRPAISVPVPGGPLPGSVQLVGQPGGEDQLLAAAAVLADRLQGRS
jgi:aspartyl-tRNA(Asn)/glutamyl-tRNA(Gln) amidotransferase subunit A